MSRRKSPEIEDRGCDADAVPVRLGLALEDSLLAARFEEAMTNEEILREMDAWWGKFRY
jgi:hypothetical protein